MKIEIEKIQEQPEFYSADMKDLPGSPPVGKGETPAEAIAQQSIGANVLIIVH